MAEEQPYRGRHRRPEYRGRHRKPPEPPVPREPRAPRTAPVMQAPVESDATATLEAEFLAAVGILVLLSFASNASYSDKILSIMKRGTLTCLLFFILALVSSAGPNAAKIARAFGALVIVGIVVTSPVSTVITDIDNIIKSSWTSGTGSSADPGTQASVSQQAQQAINSLPNIPSNVRQILSNEPFSAPVKQEMAQQYSLTQSAINALKNVLKDLGF